ncbi:o-succinylbenzoate--CoA ligase [Serratia microhaemolytica]|uniref:o-succinylbenzoate--CoA ligase n=1 Tax=Serratia microhaemolytica TaxID=2675110 RepID=UPI000FDF0CED|nr:o-succinylbenzoate--CoA ligase [Serratia microhaemolytica]
MAALTDWPWRYWAAQRPQATALLDQQQPVSWLSLQQQIDRLATGFYQQRVEPGQVIALHGHNSYTQLLAYLALLQCGALVLPLNPELPGSILNALWQDLPITAVVAIETPSTLPATVTRLSMEPAGCSTIAQLEWQPTRLATLTLTSGSVGLPKAAAHSYHAHLRSADAVLQRFTFQADDRWLLSLPLFHISGQAIIWRWLSVGAQLVLRQRQPLLTALAGCSHASLVPTQLWRLLAQPSAVPGLKQVLLGGAQIPLELTQQAEQRGIACWCGYGLTELASTVCMKRADAHASVGEPLAGYQLRLVDQEVWIRSASLAAGYWKQGQLRPMVDRQGWFHSRDRGSLVHSELSLLGRLDNLFFSGAEGVQPEMIERELAAHPQIRQVIIVPVNDIEFGQRPVAVAEWQGELSLAGLLHWAQSRLTNFQRPIALLPLPAELRNGTLKIARYRVQQWAATQLALGSRMD